MTFSLDPSQVDALVKLLETRVRAVALEAAHEVGKRFETVVDSLGDALVRSNEELAKTRTALEAVDPVVAAAAHEAGRRAQTAAAELHMETMKKVEGVEKRAADALQSVEAMANSNAKALIDIVDKATEGLRETIHAETARVEAKVDEQIEAEKRSLAAARAHVTKAVVKQEADIASLLAGLRTYAEEVRAEVIEKVSALPVTPRWCGPYSGDRVYAKGDLVIHKGATFIARKKAHNSAPSALPPPHPWELFTAAPKE